MEFWRPAERPAVMIVGPTRSGGPTIMTKGRSKGRQNSIGPDPNHVITIITTSRFSYRFLCLHPDIYCLGTKFHWPNSPGTKDHILGTRDHWLNFHWSRDQNGRGPWAKWKKTRASRLANNWNCQIVAPELKTDGQTGYTYRSRRTTEWTLQDFPTLKSIDPSNVTLTQCSSIFEYLQWRHQIWRHWSLEKRGGLITPISAPA